MFGSVKTTLSANGFGELVGIHLLKLLRFFGGLTPGLEHRENSFASLCFRSESGCRSRARLTQAKFLIVLINRPLASSYFPAATSVAPNMLSVLYRSQESL